MLTFIKPNIYDNARQFELVVELSQFFLYLIGSSDDGCRWNVKK